MVAPSVVDDPVVDDPVVDDPVVDDPVVDDPVVDDPVVDDPVVDDPVVDGPVVDGPVVVADRVLLVVVAELGLLDVSVDDPIAAPAISVVEPVVEGVILEASEEAEFRVVLFKFQGVDNCLWSNRRI
ncbi:hypothetical protein GGR54DRAFT_640698 [Hypoxylon sp. NC1633]|nr:hypothetical protein GGR54DRAFT_640698 [Hypoxylon sp. NC1633]